MFRIDRASVGSIDKKNPYVVEKPVIKVEQPPEPELPQEAAADVEESPEAARERAEQAAKMMLDAARLEAESIINEAKEQAEALRHAAYDEAYAKGTEEAELVLRHLREKDIIDLRTLADNLEQTRIQIFDDAEMELLKIAIEVGRKITDYELENMGVYMSFLDNALSKIRYEGKAKLYLDSASYARFIEEHGANPLQREGFEVALVENPSAGENSAVISFGDESIDLSVDTQIAAIKRELGLL